MPRDERKAKFNKICKLEDQDKIVSAALLLERYIAEYPEHYIPWLMYGECLYRMARYTEALVALRRSLKLWPPEKRYIVHRKFGDLHRKRGAFHMAARWYRKGVEANPDSATDRIFLGAVLAVAGRLEEAEEVHRGAIQCKQGCIDEAFLNLGMVLRAQGKFEEARKCFQRALEIDPKYKEARSELADVELALKLKNQA